MNRILSKAPILARAAFSFDPQQRYESRFRLLSTLAHRLGFRLYNANLQWHQDSTYTNLWSKFPECDGLIKDRKFVLHSFAQALAALPGDTAECGVYNGGSSFLMCSANRHKSAPDFFHHVFDSFQGLSAPQNIDVPSSAQVFKWKQHDLAVPFERVQENLQAFDFVQYHPGWIPTAFPEVYDRLFSFVHIDVDLYQPTYDSVAFFYNRMVTGGVIMCDDYGFLSCPGARQALDKFIADKKESHVIHLPTGQGFILKI